MTIKTTHKKPRIQYLYIRNVGNVNLETGKWTFENKDKNKLAKAMFEAFRCYFESTIQQALGSQRQHFLEEVEKLSTIAPVIDNNPDYDFDIKKLEKCEFVKLEEVLKILNK